MLTPLLGMEVNELEAGKISYSWQATSNHYNSFVDDIVLIVIYNETTDMFLIYDEAVRNDASFTIEISGLYAGNVLHSWTFAMKRD